MALTMAPKKSMHTALITGSGKNIGRAIAIELAANGCNVIINGSSDRTACESVARDVEALGGKALVAMGDIGIHKEVTSVANLGIEKFGSIDILVNNAAIRPSFDLLNDDESDFQRIMNVNFQAAWWLARACLPGMIENGWGRVINFSGMNAQQGYRGKSAVSIAKHAAWALTKSIAKEYGHHGVTSNIISPGTIVADHEDSGSDQYQTLIQNNPSGRLGEPQDIAAMVGYLASDNAGFVNGQLMQVNGGVVV